MSTINETEENPTMSVFTAPTFTEETERRLAVRLLEAKLSWDDNPRVDGPAQRRFEGMAEITADILGYGMTGYAVALAFKDALSALTNERGSRPPKISPASRQAWNEAAADAAVAALRGLR